MTPGELAHELDLIVKNKIMDPVLIIGGSGIGKSQIVEQVFRKYEIPLTDVRWGQLGPTDARGMPVVDHGSKSTIFYPPKFWPREAPGAIFLDEFNMASPTMMGLGQQLLLNRQFGDYRVPDGVFIWSAGNRKIDRAIVNDVPAPVNNRVAHYEVDPDFQSWELWAHSVGIHPSIIGFLKWRSELLHKFDPNSPAWPSPRTWEMADRRIKVHMSIGPVVGEATSDEFDSYSRMIEQLPKLSKIESGQGHDVDFPEDPSMRYATMVELVRRSLKSYDVFLHCFKWLMDKSKSEPDWVSMFVQDYVRIFRGLDPKGSATMLRNFIGNPLLSRFMQQGV